MLHQNLIDGAWHEGAERHPQRQPVQYRRPRRRTRAGRRARRRWRPWRPRRPLSPAAADARRSKRPTRWTRSAPRSGGKGRAGRLLSHEEGKTLPEGIGEAGARRPDLQVLRRSRRGRAGDLGPSIRPGDLDRGHPRAGGRGRADHALVSRSRSGPGRSRRPCPRQLVVLEVGRPGAGLGWRGRDHAPVRPAAGASNLVMGRGSVVGEALIESLYVAAISFTGSVSKTERTKQQRQGQRIADRARDRGHVRRSRAGPRRPPSHGRSPGRTCRGRPARLMISAKAQAEPGTRWAGSNTTQSP